MRLERELQQVLLPRDPNDERNTFLEIRAGTGGDESALFAGDLFRMYTRYAERQGWRTDLLSASYSESGGFKEVIVGVEGNEVYRRLKFESGVHRVQRVPTTESQGRIHTSAATVAHATPIWAKCGAKANARNKLRRPAARTILLKGRSNPNGTIQSIPSMVLTASRKISAAMIRNTGTVAANPFPNTIRTTQGAARKTARLETAPRALIASRVTRARRFAVGGSWITRWLKRG